MEKITSVKQVEIGMGATVHGYSDAYPYEVIKKTAKTIVIREMNAEKDPSWEPKIIEGGFAGHCVNQNEQRWIITSNEDGMKLSVRWTKKGWKSKGKDVTFGEANRFYDYNF